MIAANTPEDQRALAQLMTPLGCRGSGRERYAAAMHFNRSGFLSDTALEVFRICSINDAEDPAPLLRERGQESAVQKGWGLAPEATIHRLLDEIGCYLATLTGPGVGETRAGLSRWRKGGAKPQGGEVNLVADAWLAPALRELSVTHPALAAAIAAAKDHLCWRAYDLYPADEVGDDFRLNHCFATIVGEEAAIPAVDFDLGLFLIKPNVLYRDHRHLAPELYMPLTGPHGWRFGPGTPVRLKPAHMPVWNPPLRPHLTKVGPSPFLCLFAWTRDVNHPAEILPADDWQDLEALRLTAI